MKAVHLSIILLLSSIVAFAQDISGTWKGELSIQGQKLPLIFHITQTEGVWTSTMDSPLQGATGITVDKTAFADSLLTLSIPAGGITYAGKLQHDGTIKGEFKQGGFTLDLVLTKSDDDDSLKTSQIRPQEPTAPFPYQEQFVRFRNEKASITLAGTLTIPDSPGSFPAVVLIAGSGAQDRNSEVVGHKPFLVMADYLTRQGIAVLRYDERGVAESEGDHAAATSADLADDTRAAVAFLKSHKQINPSKIGLIGHSEGGIIAPLVAADDKDLAFTVLLAAPGIRIDSLMVIQNRLVGKSMGLSDTQLEEAERLNSEIYSILRANKNDELLEQQLTAKLNEILKKQGLSEDEIAEQTAIQIRTLTSPWVYYFFTYDPKPALSKLSSPVLALNGSLDLQVSPKENLEGIKNAVKSPLKAVELASLNHLFQESKTGSVAEYGSIEQTFSPDALEMIATWIKEVVVL